MTFYGVRAVIWDLDGVIIDSAEQHWNAWRKLAQETENIFTQNDFRKTFGQRNEDIIPRFWKGSSPQEIKKLADRKESLFRDSLRENCRALPGATELLRELHEAGWRQAIGSSAPVENIRLIIDLLEIGPFLNAAVSGEHMSMGKPAPDIFLAAARAIEASQVNCIVIEDAIAGIQAAKAADMRAVAVLNNTPNRELEAIADLTAHTLNDLTPAKLSVLLR